MTRSPTDPTTKPHGTTADQIAEMESEGQAQGQGPTQAPPSHTGPDGHERRRDLPGPDDVSGAAADQAIDTAGTEAEVDEER